MLYTPYASLIIREDCGMESGPGNDIYYIL
jgi:hypothetical protein